MIISGGVGGAIATRSQNPNVWLRHRTTSIGNFTESANDVSSIQKNILFLIIKGTTTHKIGITVTQTLYLRRNIALPSKRGSGDIHFSPSQTFIHHWRT